MWVSEIGPEPGLQSIQVRLGGGFEPNPVTLCAGLQDRAIQREEPQGIDVVDFDRAFSCVNVSLDIQVSAVEDEDRSKFHLRHAARCADQQRIAIRTGGEPTLGNRRSAALCETGGMTDSWYSARVRTVCFIEGTGSVDEELCVHVFRAADRDGAFERALEIGRADHTISYLNGEGERVEWRFAEVLTLDDLGDAELDGREVHSLLRSEVDEVLPFDTVLRPEDSEPGETGAVFVEKQ